MRRPLLLLPLVALAGCGSVAGADLPPAATPVTGPRPSVTPAGTVVAREPRATATPGSEDQPEPDLPTTDTAGGARVARADNGRTTLTLHPRARRVVARGRTTGSVGAGVGPAEIATDGGATAYVTDAVADGVVVIRTVPELAVTRRVGLAGGGPYGIVYDRQRKRLWVTLSASNEVAELAAGSRPRELRRYPSVRSPRDVSVDVDGAILVEGPDAVQRFEPED